MPLTEFERAQVESLSWLLSMRDEDRRTGRTSVLAVYYLSLAYSQLNRRVTLIDHIPTQDSHSHMVTVVENINSQLVNTSELDRPSRNVICIRIDTLPPEVRLLTLRNYLRFRSSASGDTRSLVAYDILMGLTHNALNRLLAVAHIRIAAQNPGIPNVFRTFQDDRGLSLRRNIETLLYSNPVVGRRSAVRDCNLGQQHQITYAGPVIEDWWPSDEQNIQDGNVQTLGGNYVADPQFIGRFIGRFVDGDPVLGVDPGTESVGVVSYMVSAPEFVERIPPRESSPIFRGDSYIGEARRNSSLTGRAFIDSDIVLTMSVIQGQLKHRTLEELVLLQREVTERVDQLRAPPEGARKSLLEILLDES